VELRDISDEKIDLTNTSLSFEGTSDKKKYQFKIDLFSEVDVEESKWNKTGFHLNFALEKKN